MNTTTLNMTTLDGGVIIKKGEGGSGATINNQDKVVDITENGTTEVVADGGFTGLGKVTINTEVSRGESGGSTFEYLYITNVAGLGSGVKNLLLQMAYMCKIPKTTEIQHPNGESYTTLNAGVAPGNSVAILVGMFFDNAEATNSVMDAVSAISINFSDTINTQGQVLTIGEVFAMYGLQANIDAIPRITKEQFYSLD